MAHSRRALDQVLIYDTTSDQAFWVTPAQSWRLLAAVPYYERVDPEDENYQVVKRMAGPKPEIFIEPTEDYNAEE